MGFSLRCPDCRGKFPWTKETRMPRFCPLCNADQGEERPDDDIVMPAFLSPKTKRTDQVYKDTEAGSETRMHLAAAAAGVPVSEMSGLKITDLKDSKPGEAAVRDVVNPVSQFMAQTGIGGFRGPDGSGYSGAVQSGPAPNAGARMRTLLHSKHAALSGGAVSDRPALETTQPGYRRRG